MTPEEEAAAAEEEKAAQEEAARVEADRLASEEAAKGGQTPEQIKAENERKTREIADLRAKIDESTKGYNPNDITTWDDNQLKVLMSSPNVDARYKSQAEDILFDRRVERKLKTERERDKRTTFETKRMEEFPETFERGSAMSARMERLVREMGLDSSPAGYYAAAKLAASEMKRSPDTRRATQEEKDRLEGIRKAKVSADKGAGAQVSVGAAKTYEDVLGKLAKNRTESGAFDGAFKQALEAKLGGKGLKVNLKGDNS